MSLLSSISKPLFSPIWLVITKTEVEPHQRIRLDQKEYTGTSMSETTCQPTPRASAQSQAMYSLLHGKYKLDALKVAF